MTGGDNSKLAAHIERLRSAPAATKDKVKHAITGDAIVFWGCRADLDEKKHYLRALKGCVGGVTCIPTLETVTTLMQVAVFCESKHVTRVISSSPSLLAKVLAWDKRAAPALSSYAGSYFTIPGFKGPEIEIVFIPPLKQLVTVPYGKFMVTRLVTKLTKPEKWYKATEFSWELLEAANEEEAFWDFEHAFLICIDIETFKENATIRCLSYTAFIYSDSTGTPDHIQSRSVVLPLDSEYNLAIMRKWNWQLKAPKVLQNGKYDIAYLSRYSAPVYNYLYDTANLFHSWYSELPKDLGFLNAFFIRESMYWKDLAATNDLHEYYRYNALDTWGTGNAFLAMILEAPAWAIQNYLLEFPLTFPCHMCEMTGIARDTSRFDTAAAEQQAIVDTQSARLNKILDIPAGQTFNVKSPPQMKALFKILGCGDLKSTDAKNLKKVRFRHPFNAKIMNIVQDIRTARDLVSKYLTPGKDFTRLDGTGDRVIYALNPHGTDSSRLASREHHFWAGCNIQQIPRGKEVKQTLMADPGFFLAEVDLEQAESRDTAYIAGEEKMIDAVENSPDFHCANASAFFGIPFEELFDVETGAKLNKAIRDLAKNVNHGANYNMGAYVLIETMGEENIAKAKKLLGLPRYWGYTKVAEYLLEDCFHGTYKKMKSVYYPGIVTEVMETSMLRSTAWHWAWHSDCMKHRVEHIKGYYDYNLDHNGSWTRYCFGDPTKSKPQLNSYISHPPQSLNAQSLNKAFLSVFHDIAMHPDHRDNFKLCAQIHDSILFQYREGHSYLCEMVKERMEIPVTVRGYDKKIRTFVVPAGIKSGIPGKENAAKYWSETE